MSRRRWLVMISVGLMVILSALVVHRELSHGDVMFAELDKVATTSSSVWLYYDVGKDIEERVDDDVDHGRAVVELDESGRLRFERLDDGSHLTDDEFFLRWRRKAHRIVVGPVKFRVPSGTGNDYRNAKYVELRVTSGGKPYAAGLTDADLKPIHIP